eukprot:5177131-Pleurochrysis_carterae.AAC.1
MHVVVLQGDVAEADIAVMVQVHEDPSRVIQQSAGWATHGATKHAHRVRHVGARLGRAIQQRPYQGHVLAVDVRVDATLGLCEERGLDVLR